MILWVSSEEWQNLSDRIDYIISLLRRERKAIMSFASEILDAVTAETTAVDSMIALIQGSSMTQAEKDNIISAINAERTKVETALTANVTPPTP